MPPICIFSPIHCFRLFWNLIWRCISFGVDTALLNNPRGKWYERCFGSVRASVSYWLLAVVSAYSRDWSSSNSIGTILCFLFCPILSCLVLSSSLLSEPILAYFVLSHTTLFYPIPSSSALSRSILLYLVLFLFILICSILSCPVYSYPIPCPVPFYLVLFFYLVSFCPILSYPISCYPIPSGSISFYPLPSSSIPSTLLPWPVWLSVSVLIFPFLHPSIHLFIHSSSCHLHFIHLFSMRVLSLTPFNFFLYLNVIIFKCVAHSGIT
jgi:hypothetical protein